MTFAIGRIDRLKAGLLYLTLATAALFAQPQQAFADMPGDLDDFINKAMKQYNVPGASVAIVEGDKVTVRGYGVRSVDKPGAVDADTIFMLASNSKPFTAALVGIMVDKHKLGWDDHVIDYLPEFVLKDQYATRMCTAKDLLAHSSGLPAFTGDNLEALGFDRNDCLRRFRYIEPDCSFREKANYSNPGFVAAGMLAARLGGDSYENLIKKELFQPLSMTRSGVTSKDHDTQSNVADAHIPLPQGGSRAVPWDSSDIFGPAGEINSTAKDMARWMQMQLNEGQIDGHQVLSAETVRQMHTAAMVDTPGFAEMPPINDHCGLSFGLGWGIYYYQGHKILEKGGARTGVRSVVVLVPDKKLGIAVLANQNLTVLPEAIRAYCLGKMVAASEEDMQAEIAKSNETILKLFAPKPQAKETSPPTLALEKYTGDYENELYGKVKIYIEDGKLRWQAGPNKISGPLNHVGFSTFELAWPPGRISVPEEATFVLGADGKPTLLNTESFGSLKPVKP